MGVYELINYTETYIIDGIKYEATCNFFTDTITIVWDRGRQVVAYHLDEYMKFNGSMKDFVKKGVMHATYKPDR